MVDVLKIAVVSRFSFCPGLYLAIRVSSWANFLNQKIEYIYDFKIQYINSIKKITKNIRIIIPTVQTIISFVFIQFKLIKNIYISTNIE